MRFGIPSPSGAKACWKAGALPGGLLPSGPRYTFSGWTANLISGGPLVLSRDSLVFLLRWVTGALGSFGLRALRGFASVGGSGTAFLGLRPWGHSQSRDLRKRKLNLETMENGMGRRRYFQLIRLTG